MQSSQIPDKFLIPFANEAGASYVRAIPQASQIGISAGAASLATGFPPLNFSPVAAGGVPPFGADMNGILKWITQWSRWQATGGLPTWDGAFSAAVGGYPRGAVLASTTPGLVWLNTAENNTTNPDGGTAAGWRAVMTDAAVPPTALLRAGNDTSTTANQIIIPDVTPGLDALQNFQIFEIVPNVAITGPASIKIGAFGAVPLKRGDGADLQSGDGPAGQPFLAVYLNGQFRRIGVSTSEIALSQTIFNAIYNQLYAVPGVYWRLDSPSNAVIANTQVFMSSFANKVSTVGAGTVVDQTNGWVMIGPNDGGTYVLTATGAADQPTTEEQIVIWTKPGNAGPGIAIGIARNPYPSPGTNANDASVAAIVRLAPGDAVYATYYQSNPSNAAFNMLAQPLSHFAGVRVAG